MKATVVVFDLDDTLYLERDYVRSGFRAVAQACSAAAAVDGARLFAYLWEYFESGGRGDTFDRLLEHEPALIGKVSIKDLVEVYRGHRPVITPLPGMLELLDRLAADGRSLAVITDGEPVIQNGKLAQLGLAARFGLVVATGAWGVAHAKPSPRAFEVVETWSRTPPAEHVYVGDNPAKDFRAPRERDWRTIRVRLPGQLHERAEARSQADAPTGEAASVRALSAVLVASFAR